MTEIGRRPVAGRLPLRPTAPAWSHAIDGQSMSCFERWTARPVSGCSS